MSDFIVAEIDGRRVLAWPVLDLDEYLYMPRHSRWGVYLAFSVCLWPPGLEGYPEGAL